MGKGKSFPQIILELDKQKHKPEHYLKLHTKIKGEPQI